VANEVDELALRHALDALVNPSLPALLRKRMHRDPVGINAGVGLAARPHDRRLDPPVGQDLQVPRPSKNHALADWIGRWNASPGLAESSVF